MTCATGVMVASDGGLLGDSLLDQTVEHAVVPIAAANTSSGRIKKPAISIAGFFNL